jgi:hypothetical protein
VQIADIVLVVHEDVGANLKLGQHTERCVDVMGPGSRSGHDPRREARALQLVEYVLQIGDAFLDGRLPRGIILDMLEIAVVELNAGVSQEAAPRDVARQCHNTRGRCHPRPVHAGVNVHDDGKRLAVRLRGHGQRLDIIGMVHNHHEVRDRRVESREPRDRRGRDYRRCDEQARYASAAQGLRFAQLGAANADRARRHLPKRHVQRLVGFCVRTELDAVRRGERCHRRDVAVEHLDIDNQRRRIQRSP